MSIFLDFDGTITTEDTVTHLANFALRFQSECQAKGQSVRDASHMSSTQDIAPSISLEEDDLSSRWDEVVHAYVSDYKSHVSSYVPCEPDRQCVEDEIAFLRSQKHVETRSLGRINECALFRGISPATFREAGRELVREGTVLLRPGFADFVRRAFAKGWRVNVVSVNWSAAFIEGACGFAEGEISVFANEVREDDGAVLGPGTLAGDVLLTSNRQESPSQGRNLTNSCDKRDAVREVRRKRNEVDLPFYYFGDSTTDMECLLEATRGVVIADNEQSTLIQTLRRIGKLVPHVRDAGTGEELVWASNFEEIIGVHV
ncbi:haloacid dehalogenase-like hydrolase-domain-containing protein [Xylaria bambusicola]|uniref:haloacid dehalogenase-like hydrolase-domain-containing protein n=1 Tax=Xylaria bambusicola TaxID=326684 RepID=UPI0020076A86|nr:haloacid dehalogenase-like hydrolase-domain-containing protein [Xylaria bambusicola]KAI0508585.1 haloacid dehalogenase-like hydrolase-domain-containing protein [Xylaria bambusicola]